MSQRPGPSHLSASLINVGHHQAVAGVTRHIGPIACNQPFGLPPPDNQKQSAPLSAAS